MKFKTFIYKNEPLLFITYVSGYYYYLLLDEPFEGLNTQEKLLFKRIMERLSFHNIIIMSTHLLEEINLLKNDWLFYLEKGKLSVNTRTKEVLEKFKRG